MQPFGPINDQQNNISSPLTLVHFTPLGDAKMVIKKSPHCGKSVIHSPRLGAESSMDIDLPSFLVMLNAIWSQRKFYTAGLELCLLLLLTGNQCEYCRQDVFHYGTSMEGLFQDQSIN